MRDVALERRWVGGLMIDPSVADRHGVGLDCLTDVPTRRVCESIYSLRSRGEDVNEDTLDLELGAKGYHRERQLPVMSWAMGMADAAAVAARLREMSEAREIHRIASDVARVASETGDPARAREHMRELLDLGRSQGPAERVMGLRSVAVETATALATPPNQRGGRIGWPCVDRVYRMSPGQLLVLGAQTNVGKTSAIAHWCLTLAQAGEPTLAISVEDGAEDWGAKWIGEMAGVNPAALWKGAVADAAETGRAIARSVEENAGLPLWFSEVSDRSLDSVLADMAYAKQVHGVKHVFVDYLQAITPPPGCRDMRTAADATLAALIAQAGRLGVALGLACQLSRPPKDKAYREPNKHDLKESGTIENRAQCIVMLWKDPDGQTFAKVEKVKRVDFSTAAVSLVRNPKTGALVERYDDEGGASDFQD